ncbi:MAG: sulfotransferase [Thalassobaculales bacterium]
MFTWLFGRKAAPVVVGATGGSGTRALHAVLSAGGVHMGANLNHAGDAMDFEPFLDAHVNAVLRRTRSLDYVPAQLPAGERAAMLAELAGAIAAYRAGVPAGARWGWKNPRSMYVLPLIHAICPGLRFVHVLRDGRDMALSDNQNQRNKHFAALFGREAEAADAAESIRLWQRANRDVARWGERVLGERYVRVRLEDLCADPAGEVAALFDRLGLDRRLAGAAAGHLAAPASLGRWRDLPADALAGLQAAGGEGLARFGYA